MARISTLLRVPPGPVDLAAFDPRATPGFGGSGKARAKTETAKTGARLAELQEQLYAQGRAGCGRRLLLILQGMDTSGKGGTVKHVLGLTNPMGVHYHGFGPPSVEEREQHFLWRIRRQLPRSGVIGVFDRSHYEDVLVPRVHELVPPEQWSSRYEAINRFETEVSASTRIVKCFLHISPREQRSRLLSRLDNPTKHWKYDPQDLAERHRWADYQRAYADALEKCNTEFAPWYVVPADRKWYRNWAISQLLVEQLTGMDLRWPDAAGWDPDRERERLTAET